MDQTQSDTPPPGRKVIPTNLIGARGVVVSGEYYVGNPKWRYFGIHDVNIAGKTLDIATALLRKISGPPLDGESIPTLTDIVACTGAYGQRGPNFAAQNSCYVQALNLKWKKLDLWLPISTREDSEITERNF